MKRITLLLAGIVILIGLSATAFVLYGITQSPAYDPEATVSLRPVGQGYQLMVDQQPYDIKGVAGYTYLKELKAVGGNTIRTWDTKQIGKILDSAQALDIKVIVGLPLPGSGAFDYRDRSAVEQMLRPLLATVEKYKQHPALLFWGVGNEVVYYPNYWSKLAAYRTINRLAQRIKSIDAHHPTTTMILYSRRGFLFSQFLLPDVDILSYNVFGRLYDFNDMLRWYVSQKPYLISEWGINGPWEEKLTSWGAPLENSSYGKAQQLLERYSQLVSHQSPASLGSLPFYWGEKFEITPTWFNTFTPGGGATHLVEAIQATLQQPPTAFTAPPIAYALIDQQGGGQNILVSPQDTLWGTTVGDTTHQLAYRWEIRAESIAHESSLDEYLQPQPISGLILSDTAGSCQFKAPAQSGAYRLYVYVSNGRGTATANVPFYVMEP